MGGDLSMEFLDRDRQLCPFEEDKVSLNVRALGFL